MSACPGIPEDVFQAFAKMRKAACRAPALDMTLQTSIPAIGSIKLPLAPSSALDLAWPSDNLSPRQSSKVRFLNRLQSNGKMRYKRYTASPIRYAGGKSLAVGFVVEHLPDSAKRLVSPFFGGGAVEIACANELGLSVQGYDLFDILTTYWREQLRAPKELFRRLKGWAPTKQVYAQIKDRLKAHWNQTCPITDNTELAAHYWFNHNLSYGPGFLGWMSGIYEDPCRYARLIEKVRNFRAPSLRVRQGGFRQTMARHRADFLYCDPPYYLDGDSKMFRGIYPQRNFPVHHAGFDHAALRDLLRDHKGGFILSYNDCRIVRDWYAKFEIHEVAWQYTLGQGETRIGKNRIENGTLHNVKASHELLIVGRER